MKIKERNYTVQIKKHNYIVQTRKCVKNKKEKRYEKI